MKQKVSLLNLLISLAIVAPIGLMALILAKYSVNTPWWDQMPFVELMNKLHHGTLGIGDLWVQHNEHRILMPQLVSLLVGKVTGFNFRIPVFLNLALATTTLGLLISMLCRTFTNKKTAVLLAVPAAWLLFSPAQWINWIWGFQLCFFMGVVLSVLAIWLLTTKSKKHQRLLFYLAILAAAMATYSLGNGMLVWGVGLGLLLANKAGKQKLAQWSGAALVTAASYFYKFHRSSDSLPLSQIIKEPAAVAKYIFGYIGHNLATTPIGARYTGFGLLAVFAVSVALVYKKGQITKIFNWLGVAVYVILTATVAAVSRLNFGIDHSLGSSYATISVLFIVCVMATVTFAGSLWYKGLTVKRPEYFMAAVFALGVMMFPLVSSYINNYYEGLAKLEGIGKHLGKVQNCIYTATNENDDCLLLVYPDKKTSWNDIQTLKELNWDAINTSK